MRKVISDVHSLSKQDKREIKDFIRKHQGSLQPSLVAQGGGQLGIFTAGVLDSFLLTDYDPFSLYLGTSAGALNLSSFLTRQHRFAYRFIREVTTDKRFFNVSDFIRHNKGMDLEWAIGNGMGLPEYELDISQGRRSLRGKLGLATATGVDDLNARYFPLFKHDWLDVLKATSAIPLIHTQPVILDNKAFYDGGISAAIPVEEAYRRGAKVIVVIRTEPIQTEEPITKQESIQRLMHFHQSFMQTLPKYLSRLNLNDRKEYIDRFHQALEERLEKFSSLKDQLLINPPFDMEKNGQHWLFDKNSMYRIIAMTGQHFDSDFIDILIKHYESYEETLAFLASPPDDVLIVEVAPENALKAKALLSSKEVLDNEYEVGVLAGSNFLQSFKDLFI